MKEEKMFLKDVVANKVLTDESCREYTASIIALILNIDKNYVLKNLKLLESKVNLNINNKDQDVDVLLENDYAIINIEVNYSNNEQVREKNHAYIAQLLLRNTFPGKKYDMKRVIQINLNNFDFYEEKEFIYHSLTMEEKYHKPRNDKRDIYDIDLDILQKMPYTEIEKLSEKDLQWLLYIFVCQDEVLRSSLYQSNPMMKKVQRKLEDLTSEFDKILYYNREEIYGSEIKKQAREEGLQEGRQEGRQEEKLKIAKNLLKYGMSNKDIAENTSLSIVEIEKLREAE